MNKEDETKSAINNTKNTISAKFNWLSFIFGVVGLLISILTITEYVRFTISNAPLSMHCFLPFDSSCNRIMSDGYGEILGIPWGGLWLIYWSAIISLSFLPKITTISERFFVTWRLIAAIVGFCVVLVLFVNSYLILGYSCFICSLGQITTTTFFIFSLFSFLQFSVNEYKFPLDIKKRFIKFTMLCLIPPIIVAIGTPIAIQIHKSRSPILSINPTDTPFPESLLRVNKSKEEGNGEDYRAGNDVNAKVTVQLFTDPECNDCQEATQAVRDAMAEVGTDNILFVVKFFPEDADCNRNSYIHSHSCHLAVAIRCAGRQERFWEMLNWAYSSANLPIMLKETQFSDTGINEQALSLGLNKNEYQQCLSSTYELVKIRDDIDISEKIGVVTPPFLLVNGHTYKGNFLDSDEIATAIRTFLN